MKGWEVNDRSQQWLDIELNNVLINMLIMSKDRDSEGRDRWRNVVKWFKSSPKTVRTQDEEYIYIKFKG